MLTIKPNTNIRLECHPSFLFTCQVLDIEKKPGFMVEHALDWK